MSTQPTADPKLAALIKVSESDLVTQLVCMTRCSEQAAQLLVKAMNIHIDALIQRERERQLRAGR